jgi:hypothetical protein
VAIDFKKVFKTNPYRTVGGKFSGSSDDMTGAAGARIKPVGKSPTTEGHPGFDGTTSAHGQAKKKKSDWKEKLLKLL